MMIRTDNRTLKQTPDRFYGIGMNSGAHPFLCAMIDSFAIRQAIIAGPLVGVELRIGFDSRLDKLVRCTFAVVFYDLETNRSVAFHCPQDDSLGVVVVAFAR